MIKAIQFIVIIILMQIMTLKFNIIIGSVIEHNGD